MVFNVIQMQVVSCCLLDEVILQLSSELSWLPVLQEHLVISSLLSSVEYFIKVCIEKDLYIILR